MDYTTFLLKYFNLITDRIEFHQFEIEMLKQLQANIEDAYIAQCDDGPGEDNGTR